ncbi:Chaperone protein DnaK [bacterium AB1]|nr:Chaperone protein DnaK [bacterium AB1]
MLKKSTHVFGIDLGTTYSCVSILTQGGTPKVLINSEGSRVTPSAVAFTDSTTIYGEVVMRQISTNPERSIYAIKRLMGLSYKEAKNLKLPYKVVPKEANNENSEAMVEVMGKSYSPQYISGIYLKNLCQQASDSYGEQIEKVVITVPAHFNNEQRKATKDAGEIAGLTVERIINEPTAAAMAYGFEKDSVNNTILVYDLGGGTFDVTALSIEDNVYQVLATGGDNHLGGEDFDKIIANYVISRFKSEKNVDLSSNAIAVSRIREQAKLAKENLSTNDSFRINIPFIAEGPLHIDLTVTRSWFESEIEKFINKTIEITKSVLNDSGKNINEINKIVLVGGSTRIPMVFSKLKKTFNKEPYKNINPDEAVAIGASIQGGVLSGNSAADIVLLDVTSLNLGVESVNDEVVVIIEKNSALPTSKQQQFTTAQSYQKQAAINVYQGNRAKTYDNKQLGSVILDLDKPTERGQAQIIIEFNIDTNGILEVVGIDKTTDKKVNLTLNTGSLSNEEIEKMKNDALENAEKDKLFREESKKVSEIDVSIYEAEKRLKEVKDETFKSESQSNLNNLKSQLTLRKDLDSLKESVSKLLSEIQAKVSEELKSSASTEQNNTSPKEEEGNVQEAEQESQDADKTK